MKYSLYYSLFSFSVTRIIYCCGKYYIVYLINLNQVVYITSLCCHTVIYITSLCCHTVIYITSLCCHTVIYTTSLCCHTVIYTTSLCWHTPIYYITTGNINCEIALLNFPPHCKTRRNTDS